MRAQNEPDKGKTWPQILAILIGCLSNLTCGALFSWSSPFIVKISTDKVNYDITENEASYFTVLPPVSMIISSLFFTKLNDVVGRKPILLFVAVPYTIAWILQAFAWNVWIFYTARFIYGLSDGCMYASLPMYIGEVATPEVRSTWANAMTFFLFLGQLLVIIVGSYFNVQQTSYIFVGFPILYFALLFLVPESPYFYVMKEKNEEAKLALRRLRRKEDVEEEFKQIKIDVERQMSESASWKDLITSQSHRRAILTGVFLRASQLQSGIIPFMLYTHSLFEKAGGKISSEVSSIIFFTALVILSPIGTCFLDKIGTRKSYIISTFSCTIVLSIETVYFYFDTYQPQINLDSLHWIPITGMVLFILFFSMGLSLVPTLMLSELFSASVKTKGLSILNVAFGILVIVASRIFFVLNSTVGLFAPFLLYTLTCFLSTALSFFLVPETTGKTLEEIQQQLKGNIFSRN